MVANEKRAPRKLIREMDVKNFNVLVDRAMLAKFRKTIKARGMRVMDAVQDAITAWMK